MKFKVFIEYLIKYDFIKEKRRKWLSRRHIQRDEIFRHVRSSRSSQEKRKKALCNVLCDLVADI
jgi:hypothetical protein